MLHDSRSARAAGVDPTGHGRCSSFRESVRPRMGCTFVAPGPLRPEDVLGGIVEGIYVRRMEAGNTDPHSGRAAFRVTDADRIRNGVIDAPLKPLMLFVEGASALASIDRVASDLEFDRCIGSCHRDGQPLATTVGAPTMWIGVTVIEMK
jgi:TldD protein